MLRSFKAQLFLICVITALLFPIILFSPSNVPRIIFAFPVIFFFPGYTLLVVLFPRKTALSGMHRLLLSFALSLAVVVLLLLVLNYVWSLTLYPSLISVSSFTVVISAISWWRLRRFGKETHGIAANALGRPAFSSRVFSSQGRRWFRIALWIMLIALSATILLFPVNITLDPSPIQSLNIFANFPLFAALFLTWMAVLLFLLFSRREERRNDWEKLALVCIFALVFVNFWAIKTFYDQGGDSLSQLALVRYLQEAGGLPEIPFGYFEFPGLFLFTNFLSQVTSLGPFAAAYLLRMFAPVLSVALLYLFCAKSLKSAYFASVAVLLAMIMLTGFRTGFRPDLLAYVFLLAFLVILTRDDHKLFKTAPDTLIMIILLAAVTITYFMHSMLFFFIPLGIYLVQRLGREKPINITILLLPFVVLLSWEVYWAVTVFNSTIGFIPMLVERITTGEMFSTALLELGGATGPEVPLWATATRYIKWVFFYGFGTVLVFIGLIRARRLSSLQRRQVGGVVGIILLTLLATVVSPQGSQYARYLMYAFIFLAPIVIGFFLSFSERWRKVSIILLLILLFSLSFPSFLVTGGSIAVHNVSPQEITAGEFLEREYGKDEGLYAFGNRPYGADIIYYYLPNAVGKGPREYIMGRDAYVEDLNHLVEEFKNSGNDTIFVYAERTALSRYQIFGIKPDDPWLQEIKKQLAGENGGNIIFDNDYIHIYVPPASD